MRRMKQKQSGYSLIELLIAIAVGSVILTLVVGFLYSQQQIHVTHNAVVDMQQGARTALTLMTREIRMAGYDPTGSAGAEIEQADVDSFTFTTDSDGNGTLMVDSTTWEPNERIRYAINTNGDLGRATGAGNLNAIAYNVDALEFVYLDENGNRLDDGSGNVALANIENIRAVQISLIARSGGDAPPALFLGGVDNTIYENLQAEPIFTPDNDDRFRRIILYSTAMLRNMGLANPE